jgi:hypothetical protein
VEPPDPPAHALTNNTTTSVDMNARRREPSRLRLSKIGRSLDSLSCSERVRDPAQACAYAYKAQRLPTSMHSRVAEVRPPGHPLQIGVAVAALQKVMWATVQKRRKPHPCAAA